MYKEIETIIFSKGLSKSDLASVLGITYSTFLLKLKGKYKFSLDEALLLKQAIGSEASIEDLFQTTSA